MFRNYIERKVGFNRYTEKLTAVICLLRHPLSCFYYLWRSWKAKLGGKRIVVLTFSHPQHFELVDDIPDRLIKLGYEVFIFAEWYVKLFPQYSLKTPLPVHYDIWHILPFSGADLLITPTQVKAIYYPRGSLKACLFHSLASVNLFLGSNSFLPFDLFFCAGQHHIDELLGLFKRRGENKKRIFIKSGYPKLDYLTRMLAQEIVEKGDRRVVLYCPGYYSKENWSSISEYGFSLIEKLLEEYEVILRPHPLHFKRGDLSQILEKITSTFGDDTFFSIDSEVSYVESYRRSDVMLSDVSGTAFTYFLSTGKPVVFIEGGPPGKGIHYEKRALVGEVVDPVEDINASMEKVLASPEELEARLSRAREQIVFNFGHSTDITVESISKLLERESLKDYSYAYVSDK